MFRKLRLRWLYSQLKKLDVNPYDPDNLRRREAIAGRIDALEDDIERETDG